MPQLHPRVARAWSQDENEAIVADYFAMMEAYLAGRPFNKAEHNRALQARIGRGRGSIEFKHMNISAVLREQSQPFLRGYVPADHIQQDLEKAVIEWLESHPDEVQEFERGPVMSPREKRGIAIGTNVADLAVPPPQGRIGEALPRNDAALVPRFRKADYAHQAHENQKLGKWGEEWAIEYEQRRLVDIARRPDLAKRVEWISQTRGDGAGYDIASFNADSTTRLIEVKTTGLSKDFPFFVSANEVRVSEREAPRYHLYRIFDYAIDAKLYILQGALSSLCRLEATQYRARI